MLTQKKVIMIKKLISITKTPRKESKLSRKTIKGIEKARKRIKRGKFLTESEAKERLGFTAIDSF